MTLSSIWALRRIVWGGEECSGESINYVIYEEQQFIEKSETGPRRSLQLHHTLHIAAVQCS